MFKFFKYKNNFNEGYTIVETMVAIALFLVVILYGMSALLNANSLNNKTKAMRSIIDNLNFIIEDMSRNLRTGYNYRCYGDSYPVWVDSPDPPLSELEVPRSCKNGGAIVFEEASGVPGGANTGDQWVYKIISTDGGQTFDIYKSVDGGRNFVQLNQEEIKISSISGFSVLGAEPPLADTQQPIVRIKLVGEIDYKDGEVVTPFNLQTSVSQRLVDVE